MDSRNVYILASRQHALCHKKHHFRMHHELLKLTHYLQAIYRCWSILAHQITCSFDNSNIATLSSCNALSSDRVSDLPLILFVRLSTMNLVVFLVIFHICSLLLVLLLPEADQLWFILIQDLAYR